MAVSPEARSPAPPPSPTTSLWPDAALGVLIALPVAFLLSRVTPGSYRSGAAVVAFVVVLGLALRWTVTVGAAPVLWVAMAAQISDDFSHTPAARNIGGLVVLALSLAVVVLALRRWEGDRRRARDEAVARMRNERRLQALVDLAHHLASIGSRPALLAAVESQVPAAAGSDGVIVVVRDGDRVEFPAVAGHDPAAFPVQLPDEYVRSGTPALDVIRSGGPVFCATAEQLLVRYPSLADYVERSGQRAWAALPVPGLGAMVLTWREAQAFSAAQRAFLVTIANLLAASVERIDVAVRSQLQRFVAGFDAMLDGVGIHRAVRDASGNVVDFEVEYLNPSSVVDAEQRAELVGRRMSEIWPSTPTLVHYARVVETGEPFVLEDADVTSLDGPYSGVEAVSIRASRLDDERIVLVVRDVSERVRLLREVREANEMFAVAQELAHVGSWRYDFTTDHLEWSTELYRIVGVPVGSPPVRPRDGFLFGFEHPDDRGLVTAAIGRALETRGSFTFDMRLIRQSDGEIRDVSTTGIVLVDDDGAIVGVWGATQDVTDRRRAERSRRAALDALEHERAAVAALQQVILPAELPDVDGAVLSAHYAATRSDAVGGDWYDAFPTPDGHLVLAIGDVAGHGVECAALANQLRVSVRVRVRDGMEPAEILALLDSELGDGFVTCWLAVYDPLRRTLRVANAGHLPAMTVHCGVAQAVAGHTVPPLGTQRGTLAPHQDVELESGDLLVLFTDGLVERRGEDLDVGLARVAEVAPQLAGVSDPARALVEVLAADADDDVCVVTLRVL